MIEELSQRRRDALLRNLKAWRYDPVRKAIHRRIRSRDFGDALGMMVRIGVIAERLNHHPEWCNVYDVLDVWLTTHDAGGLSENDIELAHKIDEIVDHAGAR